MMNFNAFLAVFKIQRQKFFNILSARNIDAAENFEYLQIAQANRDKIVLGNRCIYDQKAFNEVYVRCGWFPQAAQKRYDTLAEMLYPSELHTPRAIILNPGFEVVWQHLRRRWETEEKKWREDDRVYIRHACDAYTLLKNNPRVLYIDHEIDLMTDRDTKTVKTWLARCFPQNYETHINKGQTSDALAAAAV